MPELQPKIKIIDAIKTGKIDKMLKDEGISKDTIIKSKKLIKKTLNIDGIDASNIINSKRTTRNNLVTFK
jgi:hypothetical protein